MPQRNPPPPQYELGDHIAIRPDEDRASQISQIVHGQVHTLTWSRLLGDYLYGIAIPELEGDEAPKLTIVREREIWGLVVGDADSTGSAEALE